MIVIDIHEPDELKNIAVEVVDLGYDILITGNERTYYIERKTIQDFISSVYSKRIFYQINRLKEMCDTDNKYPILLLEGNIFNLEKRKYGKMKMEMFYGIITSIQEKNTIVLCSYNIDETKKLLTLLDKRSGKLDNKIIYKNKNTINIKDERYKVLCSLPGIGEKTAKKLFDKYENLYNIFSLNEDEWIQELGKTKGKKIASLLSSK